MSKQKGRFALRFPSVARSAGRVQPLIINLEGARTRSAKCRRARGEQLKRFRGLSPGSQNLVLTVLHVPSSLESGSSNSTTQLFTVYLGSPNWRAQAFFERLRSSNFLLGPHGGRRGFRFPLKSAGYVSNFSPPKALKLIA